MDNQSDKTKVTLKSIAEQLDRIETHLQEKAAAQKDAKDWKDLQELAGLFLLGAGLVYLFMTGGFGAIITWLKNLIIPG